MTNLDSASDETETVDVITDELPRPKSALGHVNQYAVASEPPRQTVTLSGVPHPAHRSS